MAVVNTARLRAAAESFAEKLSPGALSAADAGRLLRAVLREHGASAPVLAAHNTDSWLRQLGALASRAGGPGLASVVLWMGSCCRYNPLAPAGRRLETFSCRVEAGGSRSSYMAQVPAVCPGTACLHSQTPPQLVKDHATGAVVLRAPPHNLHPLLLPPRPKVYCELAASMDWVLIGLEALTNHLTERGAIRYLEGGAACQGQANGKHAGGRADRFMSSTLRASRHESLCLLPASHACATLHMPGEFIACNCAFPLAPAGEACSDEDSDTECPESSAYHDKEFQEVTGWGGCGGQIESGGGRARVAGRSTRLGLSPHSRVSSCLPP